MSLKGKRITRTAEVTIETEESLVFGASANRRRRHAHGLCLGRSGNHSLCGIAGGFAARLSRFADCRGLARGQARETAQPVREKAMNCRKPLIRFARALAVTSAALLASLAGAALLIAVSPTNAAGHGNLAPGGLHGKV